VILQIIDSLRIKIRNYLIISSLEKEGPADFQMKYFEYTNYPDAYRYFIYGQNSFWTKDYSAAKDWYLKSVQIDSNFFNANVMLSYAYEFTGSMQMAKQLVSKLFLERDQMTVIQQISLDHLYAHYFGTLEDRIKYAKQYEILNDQAPINYYVIASNYNSLDQYDLAIPEFVKALELYDKFGYDPSAIWSFVELGYAFHRTGQLKKEERLYKKAEKEFPDNPDLIYRKAILSLNKGDTRNADKYINNYILIGKEKSWTETDITTRLAEIHSEAGMLEKAEQYYRKALLSVELTSDNLQYFNNLAWFLIAKDRNMEEGIILADKALKLAQDDYSLLNTKGWGLYKQGKYKDALEILQKSWDSRLKNAIYDHEAFLHLEAAKKAVAGQK
jgi:tetratricopeptide (TPR) repeat protein